jgi:hypothetical protein
MPKNKLDNRSRPRHRMIKKRMTVKTTARSLSRGGEMTDGVLPRLGRFFKNGR